MSISSEAEKTAPDREEPEEKEPAGSRNPIFVVILLFLLVVLLSGIILDSPDPMGLASASSGYSVQTDSSSTPVIQEKDQG